MPVLTVRLVVPYLKHYWPLNPVAASNRGAVAISEVYPMSKLQLAVPMRSKVMRPKLAQLARTSSRTGKMPTPTSPS